MLKPFEIDLLREDLQAALKLLGQDEIEGAHALMRDHGFRPVDFEIIQHAESSPAFPGAVTDMVTLIRKSTRLAKSYKAGNESSWLTLFEHDLKKGAFGQLATRTEIAG